MVTLPKNKLKKDTENPSKIIIYSKPKVGKTELLATLEGNLIIDLENGSKFVEALKYNVLQEAEKHGITPLEELKLLLDEIKKEGKPYKYITIDTITRLEDMVLPLALKLYTDTPMGKSFKGDNVLSLPNGGGYFYLREAMFKVLNEVFECAPCVILLGHLKSKSIDKSGREVEAKDLDLTGKIKSIISADVDAIGLLYRASENVNVLSFKTTDDVICGARPEHLKGSEIVISERVDGKFITHWDKVFI